MSRYKIVDQLRLAIVQELTRSDRPSLKRKYAIPKVGLCY